MPKNSSDWRVNNMHRAIQVMHEEDTYMELLTAHTQVDPIADPTAKGGHIMTKLNKMVITQQDQVIAIRNDAVSKATANQLKITITSGEKALYEIASVDGDYKATRTLVQLSPITKMVVKNFTTDVASIQFLSKGEDESAKQNSNVYKHCAIRYTKRGADIMPFMKVSDGVSMFTSLEDGKNYTAQEVRDMGAYLYIAGTYSASEGRKGAISLVRVESSTDLVGIVNDNTYGSFGRYHNTSLTEGALQKLATRFGQYRTGMGLKVISTAPTALLIGKWGFADGQGLVLDREFASQLSASTDKYEVLPRACTGLMVQHRPYSVWKLESKVIAGSHMATKIMHDVSQNTDNIMWVRRSDYDAQAIYEDAMNGDAQYQGKVIVLYTEDVDYGKLNEVSVYTDLNGAKAPHDVSRLTGLNVMAIDKVREKNTVALNTQFIDTMLFADYEATKALLAEIATDDIAKLNENIFSLETSIPTVKNIDDKFVPSIVKAVAPRMALNNRRLFAEISEDAFSGESKKIENLHFPVKGKNRLLTVDPASDFGFNALQADECFIPGKQGINVILMRNPKITPGEFVSLSCISLGEYISRVRNTDTMTAAEKVATIEFAKVLTTGCIALPNFVDILDMLGGADFDGDTAGVIEDTRVTNIFNKLNSLAVRVNNNIASITNNTVIVNEHAFFKAFYKLINNGNKTIGEITYMANLLLSLIGQIKKGKREDAVYFFKNIADNNGGSEDYTPLATQPANVSNGNVVTVSFEIMANLVEKAKSIELTDDNMKALLFDLVTCHMMVQMETIDAPKKGTKVPVPFPELLDKMKQASKTRLFVSPGLIASPDKKVGKNIKEAEGIVFSVEKNEGLALDTGSDKKKTYFVQDSMNDIRVDCAKELFKTARVVRAKAVETSDERTEYERQFQIVGEQHKGAIVNSFVELKYAYNTIRSANGLMGEDRTAFMEALSNTGRAITPGLTAAERGKLAEYISMPSKEDAIHGPFAMKAFPEEYVEMALESGYADSSIYGEEILISKNIVEGDILNFVAGFADQNNKQASVREPIYGEYTIATSRGKLYATREIERLEPEFDLEKGIIVTTTATEPLMQALEQGKELELIIGKGDRIQVGGKTVSTLRSNNGFKGLSGLYHELKGHAERSFVTKKKTRNGITEQICFVFIPHNMNKVVAPVETAASFNYDELSEMEGDIFSDVPFAGLCEVEGDVF